MEREKIKYARELSQGQLYAAAIWVKMGCKDKATALSLAGYSDAVCRNPSRVFNSPAVRNF